MKFKVGQRVRFIGKWGRLVVGDLAIVTRGVHWFCDNNIVTRYVDVKWIKLAYKGKHPPQDGSYYPADFELAAQPGEQLLFDFMRRD